MAQCARRRSLELGLTGSVQLTILRLSTTGLQIRSSGTTSLCGSVLHSGVDHEVLDRRVDQELWIDFDWSPSPIQAGSLAKYLLARGTNRLPAACQGALP